MNLKYLVYLENFKFNSQKTEKSLFLFLLIWNKIKLIDYYNVSH